MSTQAEYPKDNDKKEAIPPGKDTEDMSKDEKDASEEDRNVRKLQSKSYRRIKHKITREEDMKNGTVEGEQKEVWIYIYDTNAEIKNGKYAEKEEDKEQSKEKNEDKREEKRLFEKYGSGEDDISFQQESNDGGKKIRG